MEKKMRILWCVIAILAIGNIFQFVWNVPRLHTDAPTIFREAVPDEETALIIAQTVLSAKQPIEEPRSSPAEYLEYGTFDVAFDSFRRAWIVSEVPPPGIMGRFYEVTIRMRDGRIMSIRLR